MWSMRHANPSDPRGSLRPARLAPHPLADSRWAAVEGVIAARRSELARTTDVTLDGIAGRLLLYFPDARGSKGAAEQASKGLLDVHDAPPCGCWAGYFEQAGREPERARYLLAWIPQVFVPLAERGVARCPDGSLAWLDDAGTALRNAVASLRILMLITVGR